MQQQQNQERSIKRWTPGMLNKLDACFTAAHSWKIYGSKMWRFYLHLCFTQFHQNKKWHTLNLDFISSFSAKKYKVFKLFENFKIPDPLSHLQYTDSLGPLHVLWQVFFGCWVTWSISSWQECLLSQSCVMGSRTVNHTKKTISHYIFENFVILGRKTRNEI